MKKKIVMLSAAFAALLSLPALAQVEQGKSLSGSPSAPPPPAASSDNTQPPAAPPPPQQDAQTPPPPPPPGGPMAMDKDGDHEISRAEWAAEFGKRQTDAQRELGWPKSAASYLWNGKQRYTQDLVDEVAAWLGIQPFELLMPPREARLLRRMRETAAAIVAEESSLFRDDHEEEDEAPDR